MLEVQIIDNSINMLESIKAIPKEELLLHAKDYLTKHVYISSKNLGREYITLHYHKPSLRTDYNKLRKCLSNRFRFVISLFVREGLITRYNKNYLYKRVNNAKSPLVSLSLSNDSSKTKLVYYQERFVNPKFYDIV